MMARRFAFFGLAAVLLCTVYACRCRTAMVVAGPAGSAVSALVRECETRYAKQAEERAHDVLRIGETALPHLRRAVRLAMDPDVLVWAQACVACIEQGWDFDAYRAWLKTESDRFYQSQGSSSDTWIPYVAALYTMGSDEAYLALNRESRQRLRQWVVDLDIASIISSNSKHSILPYAIELLGSEDPMLRGRAQNYWRSFVHNDLRKNLGDDSATAEERAEDARRVARIWEEIGYEVNDPPEKRGVAIERIRILWEEYRHRYESEERWERYLTEERPNFPKLRELFEVELPRE